jgi:hypothetical protein
MNDWLNGSYNKKRLQFEHNFKPYVASAIENSKRHSITIADLKYKLGTNIGVLIEEMMSEKKND